MLLKFNCFVLIILVVKLESIARVCAHHSIIKVGELCRVKEGMLDFLEFAYFQHILFSCTAGITQS